MYRTTIAAYALAPVICALLLGAGNAASAQPTTPQEVYPYAQLSMSHDWYVTQMNRWREEVDRDHGNAAAWLNLFKATRYAGFEDTLSIETKVERMSRLIDEMGEAVPNSWEYHYVRWWNGGNNLELFPELEKAWALHPDAPELCEDFATAYEILGDREKVKFYCKKWYESGVVSTGLLNYSYNVLASLDRNAIIFTVGDNDTYPLWILQHALGIRIDVTVINTSLAGVPEYCRWLQQEQKVEGDPSRLSPARMAVASYDTCVAEFIQSVAQSNSRRPVYAALTVDPAYLCLIRDDLYIVGLASYYSPKRIDNIAILIRNWRGFRLDYLDQDFYSEKFVFNRERLPQIELNYVAPAALLYEHYHLAGEKEKSEHYRNFALQIGRNGGEEEGVAEYLKGVTTPTSEFNTLDSTASAKDEPTSPKRFK